MAILLAAINVGAQCGFTLGENWTNQTTCSPNTASVGGTVNLSPPPGGNGLCPGSSVTVQLEKKNGATWVVSQSYVVNTAYGSAPYGFTGITAGIYRIVGYPSAGSNCGGCGFTTLVKPQQTVTIYDPVAAGWNINGRSASMTSPHQAYGYNCPDQSLIWNYTGAGAQTYGFQWKLYYQECNSTGGGLTGLPHGLYSTWQTGALASSYDLKTAWDAYMGSAAAVGKYFLVTLETKNSCSGTSSIKQGIVYINSGPSAPTGVLQFNGGYPSQTNQLSSHSISSPNTGGCYSSTFNLASTTGTILYFQAFIDEVNCSNGAFVQSIINPGIYNTLAGASLYSGIGINSLTPTGSFGANNCSGTLNKCYKLTVEYGNQCASSTEWTYFKLDGIAHKTDETATGINELQTAIAGANFIQLSPNPANNFVNLMIDAQNEEKYNIKIYDITGREVVAVANNFPLVRGENTFNINIADLNAGTYVMQVISNEGYRSSLKFIKNN